MQNHGSVSKSAFAALRGVSPGRVSQWISEGKLSGPAIEGEGRNALINVAIACQQLGVTLDPVQSAVNGKQSAVGQAPAGDQQSLEPEAFTDQRRMTKAKADQAEMAAERSRREFDAETGRYMHTAQAEVAWSKILGKLIAELEAAIPNLASDVARALGSSDAKTATVALRNAFRAWRAKQAEAGAQELAALESFVADPERDAPETETERRSEDKAAA
jgi:DNA-binding transcriptional regulator YdaS (Cro superfamily)